MLIIFELATNLMTAMDEIRKHLARFTRQSDEDWSFFSSKLKTKTYLKNSLILKKGQIENSLSFVESGILRLCIPKIENDITFGFVFPGGFVSAYDSFLTQTACDYQIQCLADTKLWQINYQDLQEIYANTQIGNEIGRKNAEDLFLIKSKRELSLLTKTAKERYLDLFSQRPELIQHIPLKYNRLVYWHYTTSLEPDKKTDFLTWVHCFTPGYS